MTRHDVLAAAAGAGSALLGPLLLPTYLRAVVIIATWCGVGP